MFQVGFLPRFSAQKRALLAMSNEPSIHLPEAIAESFSRFDDLREGRDRSIGDGSALWLASFQAVRPFLWKTAGASSLAAAFSSGSTLAAMRILKMGQGMSALLGLALLYFLMNSAGHFAVLLQGNLRAWVGLGSETYLAGLISRKLLRLSASAAARQSTGNLKILITSDVKNIGQFMDAVARSLIPSLAALAVVGPLLVHFAGKAGAFGLFLMALMLPISLLLSQISARFQNRSQKELDELTTLAGEWVKNVRLIRYLSWDDSFRKDLSEGVRRFMRMAGAQHFMACLIFGLSVSWWMVAVTGVLAISHLRHFPLDLEAFFGSLWLLTFLAGHFMHLPGMIRQYGTAAPSVERIASFLREPELAADFQGDCEIGEGIRPTKILFDRVSFAYPAGRAVIQDLSIELSLDRKVAIIGEVGSGKTTFLKLLCGEFPPTAGRIQVEFENGRVHDLWARTARERLRDFLAYVPQEAFVSSDLFSRNITLSGDSEDGVGVTEAAYWAELEADLAEFPNGIHQELGEGGVNLSGGQRQRLNLARAFYSRRPYLVLDDTLSAVDTRTETLLMERLEKFAGGFVLVTHRTAELMRVQEVVVLGEGSVVEKGAPALLAADPHSQFSRVLKAYEKESAHV